MWLRWGRNSQDFFRHSPCVVQLLQPNNRGSFVHLIAQIVCAAEHLPGPSTNPPPGNLQNFFR